MRDDGVPPVSDEVDGPAVVVFASFVSLREIDLGAVPHHRALDWLRAVTDQARADALSYWVVIIVNAVCRRAVEAVQNDT
jgi:hypothetical protein